MRQLDLDQPHRFRSWPDPAPPSGGEPRGRPLLVAHALRGALLAAARAADGAVVAALGYWGLAPHPSPLVVAVVALVGVEVLTAAGLYAGEQGYGRRRPALVAAALAGVTVPAVALAAFLAEGRLTDAAGLVGWGLASGLAIGVLRPLLGLALDRLARWTAVARRVLIVGDRDRAFEVLSVLAGAERRWAFPVGVCLDRDGPARPVMGGFVAGLDEAERIVREEGVDDVVVALPWSDRGRLADCLKVLRPLTVDVHLFPEAAGPYAEGRALSLLAGVPMAMLGIRPLAGARALAKAAEDKVLAALILLPLLPLMALIALAIKLDSKGPVLFRQPRYGYDNEPFTCLKFRSMVDRPQEADTRQATRSDPRVTRVGRFLRRTSLDELPQLFNVLGGSMSLVGPRPHAVSHHHTYARLVDDYRCRHRMKPGITGWAQVHGFRGETSTVDMMRKRVVHDLWYIDHWTPWLDLVILAKTPLACLKGTNAY